MAARSTKPAEVEPEEDFEEELVEAESDEDIDGTGDDLDDLELEEVDEDEELSEDDEVEEAPQKKGRKAPAKKTAPKERKKPVNSVEFGTAELLAHIESETGKKYDGRQLRVLLRKMKAAGELPGEAADGKRYSFTGKTDAKVVAIIKRVKAGEVDEATKAALDKLKETAEAKRAEKKAKKEAKEKADAKAAAEAESVEDSDEDADEEVEVEVEEAPAPEPAARRRTPAKKTTPARRAPARKKSTDVVEDDEADDEE